VVVCVIVCTNTRGGCGKVVVCGYSLYKYKGRMWKGGCEILNNLNKSLNTSCMVQTIKWKGFFINGYPLTQEDFVQFFIFPI